MTNSTLLLTLLMLNTTVWDNTTEESFTEQTNSLEMKRTGEITIITVFILVLLCVCLKDWGEEDCEDCYFGQESEEEYVEHDIRYYTVV